MRPADDSAPLARTRSRARWRAYEAFLRGAIAHGYAISSLEAWLDGAQDAGSRCLVLRHDVDQHPRSALRMAAIERDLGLVGTWYFRWRTADPRAVAAVRASGGTVGLHYETLTRAMLERGRRRADDRDELLRSCRETLRAEIAAFSALHGPSRSVCPHGDSRLPSVSNVTLLEGEDCASYGVEFDAKLAVRRRGVEAWLTDRPAHRGGWTGGVRPEELLATGVSPIMCVVHPNNWAGGADLWLDRIACGALARAPSWLGPVRSGRDAPPVGR